MKNPSAGQTLDLVVGRFATPVPSQTNRRVFSQGGRLPKKSFFMDFSREGHPRKIHLRGKHPIIVRLRGSVFAFSADHEQGCDVQPIDLETFICKCHFSNLLCHILDESEYDEYILFRN